MTSYDPNQYPQQDGTGEPYANQAGYGYQEPAAQPPVAAYGQPAYGPSPTTLKNSLGTWALCLGIASIFCCGFFTGVPAIIVGKKGMDSADQGLASNRGLAQAGMILGIVGCVLGVVGAGIGLAGMGSN